jgi:hypothetical protein
VNTYRHETSPVTDQFGTGFAHQIFDAHATSQHHETHLRTVCGEYITAAPMISPVGPPCPACAAILVELLPEPHASSSGQDEPIGLRWLPPERLAHRLRRSR